MTTVHLDRIRVSIGLPDTPDPIWEIEADLDRPTTLIAGLNASGKSLLLDCIWGLAGLIAGHEYPQLATSSIEARFSNGLRLEIRLADGVVEREVLAEKRTRNFTSTSTDEELLLFRQNRNKGEIRQLDGPAMIPVGLQSHELAVTSKRDSIQHPFLEPLHHWATNAIAVRPIDSVSRALPDATMFRELCAAEPDAAERLVADLTSVGFPVRAIYVTDVPNPGDNDHTVPALALEDPHQEFDHLLIDPGGGLYSTARILLVAAYIRSVHQQSSLFLADNFGEGLDYAKASALTKLLAERATDGYTYRLIMASNDHAVLNAVPIDDWVCLQREGGDVEVLTKESHPGRWEGFKVAGLCNFEFLATDFWADKS